MNHMVGRSRGMWAGLKGAGAALEGGSTRYFHMAVGLVVRLLTPVAIVALIIGLARVVLDVWSMFRSPSIAAGLDTLVADILSMFILIELLKSVLEYVEAQRIKLTFILDAAVVFIVREVMIGVFKHELRAPEIASLALLLLVLGAFRIAAVKFSPAGTRAARSL